MKDTPIDAQLSQVQMHRERQCTWSSLESLFI